MSPLHVSSADGVVVIAVHGTLDRDTGGELERVATAVATDGASKVEIDLRELAAFTEEGAASLVACRDLCARLEGGLHYRTGRGAGRDALLAAYAR